MPGPEQDIFCAALDMPEANRGLFLDLACFGDAALRTRIDTLLAATASAGNFLPGDAAAIQEGPGSCIGPYCLVEQIGEGGFGVVYRAEQDTPVRRTLALKIVKLGMDTRAVIARFQAERQALALMEHPHIARVFDGGATAAGRPYFVMELVPGQPLTTFCREHRLTLAGRINLFLQVCRAIHHAHQKGIIHRDLKPSNILVGFAEGRPVAKVIDFGIAKAMREPLTEHPQLSQLHLFMGTPAYMSPEQISRGEDDVDTRSDIYSLGVLLYELLTGSTPLDMQALAKMGLAETERRIREIEPEPPAQRVQAMERTARLALAAGRQTDPSRLIAELRGDLGQIVLKCLEKDRVRRYETTEDLLHDLQHYLRHEPVQARPATLSYRAGKFIRRHRTGVLAAALGLTLLASLIGYHTTRLARERDRARLEAEKARKVSDVLTNVLSTADPFRSPGTGASNIVGLLAGAAARARTEFAGEPDVRADILNAVGRVYLRMGRQAEAESVLKEALAAGRANAQRDARLAFTLSDLGVLSSERGENDAAIGYLQEALAIRRELYGQGHNDVAITLVELARAYRSLELLDEAEAASREALAIRRAVLGEHRETATSMSDLGLLLWQQGKVDEAETVLTASLAMTRRTLGEEHPNTALATANLALVAEEKGDYARAGELLATALPVMRRTMGERQWRTARVMAQVAGLERRQGRLGPAAALLDEAVAITRETVGPDHLQTAATEVDRARVFLAAGEAVAAERLLRHALPIQSRAYPPHGWRVAVTKGLLGETLAQLGQSAEAEQLLVEAVAVLPEIRGPRGTETAELRASLAKLRESKAN